MVSYTMYKLKHFLDEIEKHFIDDQPSYRPIEEVEIDSLIQESTIDLLEIVKEDEGKEDDFFLIEIEEDFLDDQPCYGPIEDVEIDLMKTGKEDDFDHKEIVVDWLDDQLAYVSDQAPDIDMLFAELDFGIQNMPILQNDVRDEAVVVADEGPTADVEESLEMTDMDTPTTVDSPANVTSGIQKKRRKLDPVDKDEKAIEADEEVDSK
jgi:hypothetical protein